MRVHASFKEFGEVTSRHIHLAVRNYEELSHRREGEAKTHQCSLHLSQITKVFAPAPWNSGSLERGEVPLLTPLFRTFSCCGGDRLTRSLSLSFLQARIHVVLAHYPLSPSIY